jgi:hypothetical protein
MHLYILSETDDFYNIVVSLFMYAFTHMNRLIGQVLGKQEIRNSLLLMKLLIIIAELQVFNLLFFPI